MQVRSDFEETFDQRAHQTNYSKVYIAINRTLAVTYSVWSRVCDW